MEPIDYLFYRANNFYKRKKDSTPIAMGCMVLTVTVVASLQTMVSFIEIIFGLKVIIDSLIIALVFLILLMSMGCRYNNRERIRRLEDRYINESKTSKVDNGFICIGYIVTVIAVPVMFGILRNQN